MFPLEEFMPAKTATFTPWFPRQADNAIFYYYLIQPVNSADTLTIQVYEKNLEDIGSGAQHGSASDILSAASPKITARKAEGLKELVRFRLVGATAGLVGVYYRILAPVWYATAL